VNLQFKTCLGCFCASEATTRFQHTLWHVLLSVTANNQLGLETTATETQKLGCKAMHLENHKSMRET
jgi:hypothetical protein